MATLYGRARKPQRGCQIHQNHPRWLPSLHWPHEGQGRPAGPLSGAISKDSDGRTLPGLQRSDSSGRRGRRTVSRQPPSPIDSRPRTWITKILTKAAVDSMEPHKAGGPDENQTHHPPKSTGLPVLIYSRQSSEPVSREATLLGVGALPGRFLYPRKARRTTRSHGPSVQFL